MELHPTLALLCVQGDKCMLDNPPLEPGSFNPFPCCNTNKVCKKRVNTANPIYGAIYGTCEDFVCAAKVGAAKKVEVEGHG